MAKKINTKSNDSDLARLKVVLLFVSFIILVIAVVTTVFMISNRNSSNPDKPDNAGSLSSTQVSECSRWQAGTLKHLVAKPDFVPGSEAYKSFVAKGDYLIVDYFVADGSQKDDSGVAYPIDQVMLIAPDNFAQSEAYVSLVKPSLDEIKDQQPSQARAYLATDTFGSKIKSAISQYNEHYETLCGAQPN